MNSPLSRQRALFSFLHFFRQDTLPIRQHRTCNPSDLVLAVVQCEDSACFVKYCNITCRLFIANLKEESLHCHNQPLLFQLTSGITTEFMAGIEGLSPAAGPVDTRPPEDEIEDDEDEDVSHTK